MADVLAYGKSNNGGEIFLLDNNDGSYLIQECRREFRFSPCEGICRLGIENAVANIKQDIVYAKRDGHYYDLVFFGIAEQWSDTKALYAR